MPTYRTFTVGNDHYGVNSGAFELDFLGGADLLIVRGGTVRAYLGDGDDLARVTGGSVQLFGQSGNDRFEIGASNGYYNGGGGNDTFVLTGGNGNVAVGRDGDDAFNLVGDGMTVTLHGDDGNDRFYGHYHDTGGEIRGGAGNDAFFDFGNAGDLGLTLYGGAGNDLYRIDTRFAPTIVELAGEGRDTVQMTAGTTWTLGGNFENLVVNPATTSFDTTRMTGNDLGNLIVGSQGSDEIRGRGGNDVIRGGGGRDQILGQLGDDTIQGGGGGDDLYGGAGSDTFVYTNLSDSPHGGAYDTYDWIRDWTEEDFIDLTGLDANATLAGHQQFEYGGSYFGYPPDNPQIGTFVLGGFGGELYLMAYTNGDEEPDLIISMSSEWGEWALNVENIIF
ncbi:hypothetical protein H8M03_12045 [Sphingomonas sabuli]|uniref:Peptidase M10 serralysin C-terminal domain-containing protein n=1 Tax=Sphingomonas sabuli TaxID=2764186 RepID=A0A7G9L260_9SPHN|nr:hypothetical protein [Sphingomonas sabuli]QNM82709.1 hypothetical protein H8M03_12045 [Sphingomonas sabuli]